MDRNRWLIFIGLCVAIIAGLIFLSRSDKANVDNVNQWSVLRSGEIPDHTIGDPAAKVILIEYGDYQCPGCHAAYAETKAIADAYKDHGVVFVFRNFPLTSAHPHAFATAAAAEAAGLQGKFWEMHDTIYQHWSEWKDLSAEDRNTRLESYAQTIGLNLAQFKTDISSQKVTFKINKDRALGAKSNVEATPSFFLDSKKLSDEIVGDVMQQQGNQLRDALDAALKAQGLTPPERPATDTASQP